MKRTITIEDGDDAIRLVEDDVEDWTEITIEQAHEGTATIVLRTDQLWKLAEQILLWFGAKAVRPDEQRATNASLRGKLFDVLVDNESRCLDDNIDRDVVLRELLKALS